MIYVCTGTGKVFCGWWMTLPQEKVSSQILGTKGGKCHGYNHDGMEEHEAKSR